MTTKKSKVRILFISLRSDYGGGPAHMFDIVTYLNSSFEKYVACPIQKPFYDMYKEKNIKLFSLPVRTFSIVSFFKLVWFTKRNYIDIIHSHGKGAGIYSRLLSFLTKVPVVHTFHGIHYEKYSSWKQKLYFIMEREMSKLTKYIINVSRSEHEEGLRLKLFPKSKARVIYNGVDIETMCKCSIDTKLQKLINSTKKDNVLICTVARFDYVKGIDVAIKAMKCLKEYHKNFKYVLIGDGELKDEIVKEINNCRLNNKILLLGFRDDVPGILRMMDIYLSPSRSEGMSLTLLESMCIGLPVVATDISGNKEVLKKGLLARSEDPLDLASKLNTLINSPELRNNLSEIGKEAVRKHYTLENMIRKTESLYNELLFPRDMFAPVSSTKRREIMRVGINDSKSFGINTDVGRYTSSVRMKIAIDTRMIGPFAHGISRYAFNIIKIISEIDRKNDYLLISNNNYLKDFVSSRDNITLRIINSRLYGISEQFRIPRIMREECVDVFHSPSYFGPVYGSCRTIMTIHDIVPLLFPQEYSILHRLYYHVIVKKAAMSARKIITVSENSRNDINKHLGISLDKIVVTHNAVDEKINIYRAEKVNSIKGRYGINGRYLLYVGNQKPHKNVPQLIRAYNLLKYRTKHQLVIAGEVDRSVLRCLPAELLEGVVFTGEVPDDNLSCLYSGADLYVSASLYEGFGLPFLEAMACGTPVVALKTPSLYEVVGDAGYMVEENSPEGFADAVCNILSDVNKQRMMIENGFKRVQAFSWEETASKTLEVYEKVGRA